MKTTKAVICSVLFFASSIAQAQEVWTQIGPSTKYQSITENPAGGFTVSTDLDVFTFSSPDSAFRSLGWKAQFGDSKAPYAELLGYNDLGELFRATAWECVYRLSNGGWTSVGLCGYGTGGQYWVKAANGRFLMTKGGFLRNIYFSDNQGLSWTAAGTGDVDWNDLAIADNGDLFAISAIGGVGAKGLLKSSNNGTTWNNVSASVPLSVANSFTKTVDGHLFVLADGQKILRSADNGTTFIDYDFVPVPLGSPYARLRINSSGKAFLSVVESSTGRPKIFAKENFVNSPSTPWIDITNRFPAADYYNYYEVGRQSFILTSNGLFALDKADGTGDPVEISLNVGLIAHYPLDGHSSDISGNELNGEMTDVEQAKNRFGIENKALGFNGVSSKLHIESRFMDVGRDFSISLWVNVTDPDKVAQTFVNTDPHHGLSIGYHYFDGVRSGYYWKSNTGQWDVYENEKWGGELDPNSWYHVVATQNGDITKLFVDSNLLKVLSTTQSIQSKMTGMVLGALSEGRGEFLSGQLDDIRIYNRALSDAEVAALFALESTPPPLAPDEIADIDGNRYKTVRIGDQVWMAENLRTSRYQDGTPIPNVTDGNQWGQLNTGAWAYYNNDPAIGETYGKLYNWYAAADERNVCPVGWTVPTDEEWTVLSNFLGVDAGFKMKSTTGWSENGNGSNESGFNGLPGGYRHPGGEFDYFSRGTVFWSSSELDSGNAWYWDLVSDGRDLRRWGYFKSYGFSIRCVRPYSSQTASSDTWTLPVRATSSTGLFADAALGVSPSASDGLDSLDVPAPPTPPGESLSLFTSHPEWNWILGSRVSGDIRASVDLSAVPNTWELTLSSTGASSGALTLDRPQELNWPIVVLNGSNRWLSRSGDLVVPFAFTAAGNQTFTVQVGDTTAPELQAGAWFEGPAILDASATHSLHWQASDLNHLQSVELEVSHDDGATWSNVYAGTGASINWTPSGNILFNESTRFSLTATDRAGNGVSQTTQSPISVMAPRQAVDWPQGWSMRGSAYSPTNQTNSVMGEAFRFGWTGTGYQLASGFQSGNALWVGSTIAGTDTLSGTVAGQGQILQLPAGWNMITAPLLRTVYGDSIRVTHSGNGRSLRLSEAIDSLWVTTPLAYVNNAYAAANRMTPFSGYWMGVLAPGVSLELPIHAYSTAVSKETTQEEPMVSLLLQDGAAEQVLSVKQGSGVPAPPPAPNAERVGLRGLPTILGELYLVAGAQVDAQSTHPLVIGGSPRSVTLSWTDQTFAGMTAVLQLSDRRYDLTRANTVSLRSDESAQVIVGPISTSTEPGSETPFRTELMAAYPNPFNPSTVVSYRLSVSGNVRLAVYDILGRQVAILADGNISAGSHQVTFDATGLASGVYIYRLEAGGEVFMRRMTLVK